MLRKVELITDGNEIETTRLVLKLMTELLEAMCKFCGSPYVVRNGKSRKGVQNWLCRTCGKAFVDNKALPGMRSPMDYVGSTLYLYYTGSSLNEIRRHIEQQCNVLLSDATIYNWVTRFTKVAKSEAEKHTPKVGNTWIANETVLKIGGKKYWLWDIIDSDTRFLLATHLSLTRMTRDAQKLMKLASERAGRTPEVVITDKLASYLDGIELEFGAETKHIRSKPFTDQDSTNLIERFHGTLKDRTKVMRGMKTAESARLILDGWLVYYNFFRPHESLKDKSPAEVAGIKFPYRHWLDIVMSQSPVVKATLDDNRTTILSADYYSAKRLKKIRKRRVRKARAREMTMSTVTTMRGV